MTKRTFTPDEISLIHRTLMVDKEGRQASKDDLALFIATCERTGLDPFSRQIMASSRNIKKGESWVVVWNHLVTIDGFRKIAAESSEYEGQEGPFWCGQDGVWKDLWTGTGPCYAAKVLVHRKGFKMPLSGIAKYESYVQKTRDGKPNNVWASLGDHMTAKCAEALALRRAFPNELAGLYTTDEIAQAKIEELTKAKDGPVDTSTMTASEINAINGVFEWMEADVAAFFTYCDTITELGTKIEAEEDTNARIERYKAQKVGGESPEKVLNRMVNTIDSMKSNCWSIEAQQTFADGLDALYAVLREGGKEELYEAEATKWRKRMAKDGAGEVLAGLEAYIKKLQNAVAKKALEATK